MLGGFTRYLAETLAGSRAWQAMRNAHRDGAVIGGSSAGAMVLCESYFDPFPKRCCRASIFCRECACCLIMTRSEKLGVSAGRYIA